MLPPRNFDASINSKSHSATVLKAETLPLFTNQPEERRPVEQQISLDGVLGWLRTKSKRRVGGTGLMQAMAGVPTILRRALLYGQSLPSYIKNWELDWERG